MAPSARTRSLRWVAPFATAAVIALIVAIPGLSAAGTPPLAPITPAELLAKAQHANVTHFSGTINLTTNLGIPNLSALADLTGGGHSQAFNPTSLLSGTHQALVWFSAPGQARIDLLQSMAETDLIHNGQDVWLWDSTSKTVNHYLTGTKSGTPDATAGTGAAEPMQTPQQVADKLLAQVTPSTSVSVGSPVVVASQDAYQLILAPHAAASTIDQVVIAVDSNTSMPLQVQVFAKGQKAAALTLGFGTIDYKAPPASEFAFTPPAGSKVIQGGSPMTNAAPEGTDKAPPTGAKTTTPAATGPISDQTVGQDWTTVEILHNVQVPAQLNQYLQAAQNVTTAAGPGKLLPTALVNVLVMNDGRVAVGAVDASTLEAAIAAAP